MSSKLEQDKLNAYNALQKKLQEEFGKDSASLIALQTMVGLTHSTGNYEITNLGSGTAKQMKEPNKEFGKFAGFQTAVRTFSRYGGDKDVIATIRSDIEAYKKKHPEITIDRDELRDALTKRFDTGIEREALYARLNIHKNVPRSKHDKIDTKVLDASVEKMKKWRVYDTATFVDFIEREAKTPLLNTPEYRDKLRHELLAEFPEGVQRAKLHERYGIRQGDKGYGKSIGEGTLSNALSEMSELGIPSIQKYITLVKNPKGKKSAILPEGVEDAAQQLRLAGVVPVGEGYQQVAYNPDNASQDITRT